MKDTSKLRLILICQLLIHESDAEHPLTIAKIRKILKERYDLETNRNTVTDDLNTLSDDQFAGQTFDYVLSNARDILGLNAEIS